VGAGCLLKSLTMSFAVQLTDDLSRVEPGSTVPVSLEVVNRTDSPDRYEIEVEGLDPNWTAMPVPSFLIEPRETHVERFFLKPPRDSESLAGTYPYVVNVRSIETGESRSVQGALEVKPYTNLSIDVQPKRGKVSPFAKTTEFQVTIMNLGNGEQTLQLFAADNDSLFAFEFDVDQVTLAAGQTRTVTLSAAATKSSLLASSRLQNFSVSARSSQNAAVAAQATGQIEQRALATPGGFLVAMLLIGVFAAWVAFWPKKPTLDSIIPEPQKVTVGQPVSIKWDTSHATRVAIRIGNWTQDHLRPDGSTTYVPDKPGDYAIEVDVFNGDMKITDNSKMISVTQPPTVPAPTITELSVDSRQVNLGQTFMLNYKFGDSVARAMLYPMQRELDVKAPNIQLTADNVGKNKYTVKAFNSAGQEVEQSVTVTVVKLSKSKIVRFEVTPLELDELGGTVGVDLRVTNAARIDILVAGQKTEVKAAGDPASMTIEDARHLDFTVTKDTTFKLVAYDDEGIQVASKEVTVKVKKPPPSEGAPDTPTTGGTGH